MMINALKHPNSNNTINSKSHIPNILNEPFMSVGPNLAKQLSASKINFTEFLEKNKSPASSFFQYYNSR